MKQHSNPKGNFHRSTTSVVVVLSLIFAVGHVFASDAVPRELEVSIDTTTTNDRFFTLDASEVTRQWALSKISVPDAWDIVREAPDVVVAVVDTGINARHLDLRDGRVLFGFSTSCSVMDTIAQKCVLRIQTDIPAGADSDVNGHGTEVAGIIGAIANNGFGVAGIAWKVKLMPVRVLDASGSGFGSDVAEGIRWAVDSGADIINLSLGGVALQNDRSLSEAIAYAFNRGVLLVAAVGNDQANHGLLLDAQPVFPACDDQNQNMVLGVAALNMNDTRASFSNYGTCVDVAAPGVEILTTESNPIVSSVDTFVFKKGTSFAAPHVTGIAALLKALKPEWKAIEIRDRILATSDSIDRFNFAHCNEASCAGKLGRGRVNAKAAVQNLASPNPPSPIGGTEGNLLVTPSGRYYIREALGLRPVSLFVLRQRGIDPSQARLIAESDAAGAQDSWLPPAHGTLVKAPNDPTVFFMEGVKKRPITFFTFIRRGFDWKGIVELSLAELASWEQGDFLPPPDGTLVKASDSPAVFFLENGMKRWISLDVFRIRQLRFQNVISLSPAETASYPNHPRFFLPPPDGILVKGRASPGVFLMENGQRRLLSLAQFLARKYSFRNVRVLPQVEVDAYPAGESIL